MIRFNTNDDFQGTGREAVIFIFTSIINQQLHLNNFHIKHFKNT